MSLFETNARVTTNWDKPKSNEVSIRSEKGVLTTNDSAILARLNVIIFSALTKNASVVYHTILVSFTRLCVSLSFYMFLLLNVRDST